MLFQIVKYIFQRATLNEDGQAALKLREKMNLAVRDISEAAAPGEDSSYKIAKRLEEIITPVYEHNPNVFKALQKVDSTALDFIKGCLMITDSDLYYRIEQDEKDEWMNKIFDPR